MTAPGPYSQPSPPPPSVVLVVATWAVGILVGIHAAKATNEGRNFRYPFGIDVVR